MDETNVIPPPQLSYGQKAVGLTFNPGKDPEVDEIKKLCAAVIDKLHDLQRLKGGEASAQFQIAIRAIQDGQMWGVKAQTWQY